ncbi:MAG TPA: hypothetical protein VIX17_00735 [Pyrinomonadaceae bacterium]|jgi:hypothetical protein
MAQQFTKEFFDKIRREVKEREEAHGIPLEQRAGISVFPPDPKNLPDDPLRTRSGITVVNSEH